MRLNSTDRCALLIIQMLAFVGMMSGLMMLLKTGYSISAMIFLVCGGTITLVILIGLLCQHTRNDVQDRNSPAVSDPPPKYRLTWRKEFLRSIPEELKADIEKSLHPTHKRGKRRRRGTQVVWTTDMAAGVHRVGTPEHSPGQTNPSFENGPGDSGENVTESGNQTSINGTGSRPSRITPFPYTDLASTHPSSSNSGASQTGSISMNHFQTNYTPDEGLPTYEEVQRWF